MIDINSDFISKAYMPMQLLNIDTLRACSKGLKRRMKTATKADKERLKMIKTEIDFLIENL